MRNFRWKRAAVSGAALCLAAASTVFTPEAGATALVHVNGHFTFDNDSATACAPAGPLCYTGDFTGGIQGRFENTITSLAPSAVAGVSYYSGSFVLRTDVGNLKCGLAGALSLTSDYGEFGEICEITGGDGTYAGASGYLRMMGVSSETDPVVVGEKGGGEYEGKIILP